MKTPRISVVMPVYNAGKHIEEAISSILGQTYSDFEFIIINDGSTDNSVEIIESFTDSRIRLIHNEKNLGMTISLNKGIELSRGEYIARMDADDNSLPLRFEKQIEFLDKNPEIGVLGTNTYAIGESSKPKYKIKYPENHSLIKWSLLFSNPMCHPSVMIRKSIIDTFGFYDIAESKKYNQDYDLWTRLIYHTKFHNLRDELLYLRTEGQKISTLHFDAQTDSTININRTNLSEYLGDEVPEKLIRSLWTWRFSSVPDAKIMIETIIKTNEKYFGDFKLPDKEIALINRDTARRILLIAVSKLYSPSMVKYIFKTLKYDRLGIFRTLGWGIKAVINKYLK